MIRFSFKDALETMTQVAAGTLAGKMQGMQVNDQRNQQMMSLVLQQQNQQMQGREAYLRFLGPQMDEFTPESRGKVISGAPGYLATGATAAPGARLQAPGGQGVPGAEVFYPRLQMPVGAAGPHAPVMAPAGGPPPAAPVVAAGGPAMETEEEGTSFGSPFGELSLGGVRPKDLTSLRDRHRRLMEQLQLTKPTDTEAGKAAAILTTLDLSPRTEKELRQVLDQMNQAAGLLRGSRYISGNAALTNERLTKNALVQQFEDERESTLKEVSEGKLSPAAQIRRLRHLAGLGKKAGVPLDFTPEDLKGLDRRAQAELARLQAAAKTAEHTEKIRGLELGALPAKLAAQQKKLNLEVQKLRNAATGKGTTGGITEKDALTKITTRLGQETTAYNQYVTQQSTLALIDPDFDPTDPKATPSTDEEAEAQRRYRVIDGLLKRANGLLQKAGQPGLPAPGRRSPVNRPAPTPEPPPEPGAIERGVGAVKKFLGIGEPAPKAGTTPPPAKAAPGGKPSITREQRAALIRDLRKRNYTQAEINDYLRRKGFAP